MTSQTRKPFLREDQYLQIRHIVHLRKQPYSRQRSEEILAAIKQFTNTFGPCSPARFNAMCKQVSTGTFIESQDLRRIRKLQKN